MPALPYIYIFLLVFFFASPTGSVKKKKKVILTWLRPATRTLSDAASVGAAYPIIREAVVCVERGLRQVNNPQPF